MQAADEASLRRPHVFARDLAVSVGACDLSVSPRERMRPAAEQPVTPRQSLDQMLACMAELAASIRRGQADRRDDLDLRRT